MPMPEFADYSGDVGFQQQLQENDSGPVVLLNVFTVPADKMDEAVSAWKADASVMKRQPGLISAQLYIGAAGANQLFNYAVWESTAHLRAAFENEEFQAAIASSPAGVVARPLLFKKIAVPGICVA